MIGRTECFSPGYLEINVESQTGLNEYTKVDGDNTPVSHPNYILPGVILLTLKSTWMFVNLYQKVIKGVTLVYVLLISFWIKLGVKLISN